uniref:Laminin subunit alpha n=1 Tax=Timema shepardi TaxID=629360 RepID=A0A7R9AN21_TIMSH|nr:unnamed protein product [Timema shepardi]
MTIGTVPLSGKIPMVPPGVDPGTSRTEFHVAYVFIKMANSPRPGVWVLERSTDNGETFQPWQFFADSIGDCESYFGRESLQPITRDDSATCETQYSKIVPLEGGEIVVSLLNNRPSANDFFNSTVLQEWTRATNVRFRLLRHKTFLGHLMSVARQDPTVTRRYFYSIKDISIGGRCVCNGHADTCDITDPDDPFKLLCRCQHHTCGANCDRCCPGFEQKAWRISKSYKRFICEPCNCFGHSEECMYDKEIDSQHLSLDIQGNYEGGGVCQNCRDNTEGVNCDRCKAGFFRPYGRHLNETDVCQPCNCNNFYSTGSCAEGSGQCECRPEFNPPNCDSCSFGYFDYPNCKPCECHLNGTRGFHCEADGGQCPCKQNYAGKFCDQCNQGFYNFPECLACECNYQGSLSDKCEYESGQCSCKNNYGGRTCDQCQDGYFDYPQCSCTESGICDKQSGQCLCKEGYGGDRCDQCIAEYYGYPDCKSCGCSEVGSASTVCDASGKCPCLYNFAGRTCDQCNPGYFKYPECLACNCDSHGGIGISCDTEGTCQCKNNFAGSRCDQCKEGFYNFPICEECNCDPTGVIATFAGCGSLPPGELCQCKERVHGRICDECRPLYWNLQAYNPLGCEAKSLEYAYHVEFIFGVFRYHAQATLDCDCHLPGVVGGLGVCDTKSGQCVCKGFVKSRRCDACIDGTYNLQENNLFGCSDCGCDIGGSVDDVCNKETGECVCRPRITGRTCKEPLQTHYYPTLYQFQYEVEDGHTPANTPVRFAFDESLFRGYSWKGYAVFSQLQNEVIQDVFIQKPAIYRMVLRYVNPSSEPIIGVITITPDNPSETEQDFEVQFKPSKEPTLVTVSKPPSSIPSPLVMNPGRWSVSIKNQKSLFVDYFVFIPDAYYEATKLVEKVDAPCEIGNKGLCRHFRYPNLTQFDVVHGEGGYLSDGENREALREYFTNAQQLNELNKQEIPLLNSNQREVHLDLRITKPGRHVLLVNYLTPTSDRGATTINVETSSQRGRDKGSATLYACPYTMICRQAVLDRQGRVGVFHFDTNFISLNLKAKEDSNIALESVVAIPYEQWSLDYQEPKTACVRKDGKCVQANFLTPPDSKKVEFEQGNEQRVAKVLPRLFDNSTRVIYLDHNDSMIDITGKVPYPGHYVFVVHYFQPDHPEFNMDVLIHNGQVYEAKLPVQHCPSNSGCRSIVKQQDGNTPFYLTENFVFTLKEPNRRGVWVDYLLVIPAEQFTDRILREEPIDHTGKFINQCGKNHFYVDNTTDTFCKETVFSLTSDYNNGALPCQCDFDGSLSFECEPFGGQCPCKPNIIGRRCEICKTGYFGFPNCKPCDCPSTALCETYTGECICPPRVTGERCNQCIAYTYGFDPIIGCEECNCEPLGVARGNLQCDLFNGSCQCKANVVGRTCDRCRAGNWGFPYCQHCDCDRRGTTDNICDQLANALAVLSSTAEDGEIEYTAECYCKNNVNGQACDLCNEGTFNIQEKNPDGCTKCFCFGKTPRCSSSSLYRSHLSQMTDWSLVVARVEQAVSVEPLDIVPDILPSTGIGANLLKDNRVVYFSAPPTYLNNKLTAYGGLLNYTVYYTTGQFGIAVSGPDVILRSGDLYLLHFAIEQPPAAVYYSTSLDIVENEFLLASGIPASREQIMQTLENLEGIYIRATYWEESLTSRLEDVSLDIAVEGYNPNTSRALAVEQCQCPPNYWGLSCEDCAPGYYRTPTGPYGGFCVPCQCNGHSDVCDQITGVCLNCRHNTTGEHCDKCAVGFHGNATNGTPVDCLICACPLPIASNNFASGCDVSLDGERISCDCDYGYYGARCESCAAGFYGRPELAGDYCRPCQCSGNINPEDPGSCDSVTGDCLRCLNNTFGTACNLCAPGFFGDAVELKDCKNCDCDKCGTRKCDSYTGKCDCHENVVGEKCDRCELEHYGFSSCQGCRACDCQLASESSQCNEESGQCRCKPGVSGRTCDRCAAGFWNYGSEGCVTCGCNTEYSIGFGCNPSNGQCECLPGVIGEKCDHCPYRWVLIPDEGCFECDSCSHDLLDVTDQMKQLLDPVVIEFETVAQGYFTNRRLLYINETANQLGPKVNLLDPLQVNLEPITQELESLEQDSRNLNRRVEYAAESGEQTAPNGEKVRNEALEVEELIRKAVGNARDVVGEVSSLAFSLDGGDGTQIDYALRRAQEILEEIQFRDFTPQSEAAREELFDAHTLLARMEEFSIPVHNQSQAFRDLRRKIHEFDDKLGDLQNYSRDSIEKVLVAQQFNDQNRNAKVTSTVNTVKNLTKEANSTLLEAKELLKNATDLLNGAGVELNTLYDVVKDNKKASDSLEEIITKQEQEQLNMESPAEDAANHAQNLTNQANNLDNLLAESRYTSENAVGAANAYKNIEAAIQEAIKAAEDAGVAAQNATDMSQGLDSRTRESEERSTVLLEGARKTLDQAQTELEPQLEAASQAVAQVQQLNDQADEGDNLINRLLNKISNQPLQLDQVMEDSLQADQVAQDALDMITEIVDQLPEEVKRARQLPKTVDETNKAIQQANNQIERVSTVVPDINRLMKHVADKQSDFEVLGTNVKSQIELLKQKVAMARDLTNRIKVGMTFYRNTTLQLKNPDNLDQLGTSSKVSVYFRTPELNGFLLYLGNEVGTSKRVKRAKSDDFMAVEIENGYPKLTIDLGSEPATIISDKFVSDNVWTGKNVKFTIREQTAEGRENLITKEQVMPGARSILNLDKEHSLLLLGGYPQKFLLQPDVRYSAFVGEMEELVIGDVPLSLWNFVDSDNNNGALERDKLVNLQSSTGYRFDGNGYAIVSSRPYRLRPRSSIQLRFKTFEKNGLLFLAGKGRSFLSIELNNGNVVYQAANSWATWSASDQPFPPSPKLREYATSFDYNLGQGALLLKTTDSYNNGQWHTIDAVRQGKQGVLKVGTEDKFQGEVPGTNINLQVSDNLYFGGYPGNHNYRAVSNEDFNGCIDGVEIDGQPVDLSQNVQAFGVIPGCPVQMASLVAFEEQTPGYLHWPNASANNFFQVNFKFKTSASTGLLFYAANRDQSSTVSLSLVEGGLALRSGGEELTSGPSTLYNDDEWHVITATHDASALHLDIDDFETFQTDTNPPMLQILYGKLYFGGIPSSYEIIGGATATSAPFIGCLGDATVNGMFINFANATDRVGTILGKCSSSELPRPEAPTIPEDDGLPITPEEGSTPVVLPLPTSTQSTPVITDKTKEVEPTTDRTTYSPTTPTIPTPAPTPTGECVLPVPPATDLQVDGVRFG